MNKTTAPTQEQKTFAFQVKELDDVQGIVRGYLSTFDNVDEGGDRVRPKAFKRTLANKYEYKQKHGTKYLFPLLWQHDTGQPIGGYTEAKEDDKGLFVELQVDLDVQRGREAFSGLQKGYICQQSMGYDTLQSEYVKVEGKTVRDLIEVRLWEGSIVTFPMNTEAVVTSVKSDDAQGEQTETQRKDFNTAYQERLQGDWLDDLWTLWFALKDEIMNAFRIGDQPVEDVQAALDQFSKAVLSYVQQGIDLGMVEALQPSEDNTQPYSGYMSNDASGQETKEGRMISSANHATMTKAVQGIMEHCKSMTTLLQSAKPEKSMGAAELPQQTQEQAPQDDSALSTQLDELLASVQMANFRQSLKKG